MAARWPALIIILICTLFMSLIKSQGINTTANSVPEIDYCVGPLVYSPHPNPIQKYGGPFSKCGLSCESGKQLYGLSTKEQQSVDYTTIIGTILCLIGLFVLSINLYFDKKVSREKFIKKPILFHIPYIITLSTFILTLLMSLSLIFGKETVICSSQEFSYWNPGDGKSSSCTTFGIFFYSSLLYYMLYVLLLSFIVWRQFINPLKPLWNIRDRYWHLLIFIIVFLLNIISLATSSVDAIEPMGVCLAGVADKTQLFCFLVLPISLSCVFSAIFLIWCGFLLKSNIDRHKHIVNRNATTKMVDLFQRILWYGFGVLFTLSLLFATGLKFYLKHDMIREGLKDWINCELQNALTNINVDCYSLRDDSHKISPFWFMSWIISCILGIFAQIVLSFHSKARQRAALLKTKTLNKINTTIHSPRRSKESNNKLELKSDDSNGEDEIQSPITETENNGTSTVSPITSDNDNDNVNVTMMAKLQSTSPTSQSIQETVSE